MTDTKRILYDFESFQVLKGVHLEAFKILIKTICDVLRYA